MAVSHGKNGKVKASSTLVAETRRWRLSENVPVADTTAQGDAAQTHAAGIPGWTAEIECVWDPSDSPQAGFTIGASVDCEFYPNADDSGKTYWSGTATVIDTGIESAHDGANMVTINVQGNGALTKATV